MATLFTTACCIGLPAVVSLATALGAGFLLTDRYLQPLLTTLVLVTIAAGALTYRRHRNLAPLLVTVLSADAIYWFNFFESREAASTWAAARGIPGRVLDLAEAAELATRNWEPLAAGLRL